MNQGSAQISMFLFHHKKYVESREPILQYACIEVSFLVEEIVKAFNSSQHNELILAVKNLIAFYKRLRFTSTDTLEALKTSFKELFELFDVLSADKQTQNINWKSICTQLFKVQVQLELENIPEMDTFEYIPKKQHIAPQVLLGKGAFGAAYRISLNPGNIECCMKIVDRNRLEAYGSGSQKYAEKIVGAVTSSPFIVKPYISYIAENAYVSIMEVVEGGNLDTVLYYTKIIPPPVIKPIAAQLVLAVEHMHFRGMIHRDIKPSNMIINMRGCVKLADFELTSLCNGHHTRLACSSFFCRTTNELGDGNQCGSVFFTAPEVLNELRYGRAIDWYSVGVTLYKLMIGHVPLKDNGYDELPGIVDQFKTRLKNFADQADFVAKFLVANPDQRLGSRSYQDIETHKFLVDINLHELWRTDAIITDQNFLSIVQRVSDIDVEGEEDMFEDEFDDSGGKQLRFEHLIDKETDHLPIYTFVWPKFAKLVDAINANQGRMVNNSDEFLKKRASPLDLIDYRNTLTAQLPFFENDAGTTLKSEEFDPGPAFAVMPVSTQPPTQLDDQQQSSVTPAQQMQPLLQTVSASKPSGTILHDLRTAQLVIKRGKGVMIWGNGFDMCKVYSKSGQTFFVVTDVKRFSGALKAGLRYGDIIVSANGRFVSDCDRIPWVGSKVSLEVSLLNPFRCYDSDPDELLQLMSKCPQTALVLKAQQQPKRGSIFAVKTKDRQVWVKQAGYHIRIHIVNYVAPSVQKELIGRSEHSFYVGDLILSIGEEETRNMTHESVRSALNSTKTSQLSILVSELSPLRLL